MHGFSKWYLGLMDTWANPWLWVSIAFVLFLLGLLGLHPLTARQGDKDIKLLTHVAIFCRKWLLFLLLVLTFFLPGLTMVTGKTVYGNRFIQVWLDYLWEGTQNLWPLIAGGLCLGYLLSFVYSRYTRPWISALKRKLRVRQSGDELSDIRVEREKFSTRTFDPRKFYREGFMFFGLDQEGSPVLEEESQWRKRHQRFVGPTQSGKGVLIGVELDQAIRKGYQVWFVDPKPDKHGRAIMQRACEQSGRTFTQVDLNPGGIGHYAPFRGGIERDRRARLFHVLGLGDSGEESDFYKAKERESIDALFRKWNGHLPELQKLLSSIQTSSSKSSVERSKSYISEWMMVSTFRTGLDQDEVLLSVKQAMLKNEVVYIKGNLNDDVVITAMTILIMEIIQEAIRLYEERNSHTVLVVDELAFLINGKIADAMATLAGFDCNMIVAYQTEGDLKNLKDSKLNPLATQQRVKGNCKTAIYYGVQDDETAEVMAKESGYIQKQVTRAQGVLVGRHLEETWDDKRDVHKVEENLYTTNVAKMLPERVGIMYQPQTLARVLYTSWVPINLNKYKPPQVPPKKPVTVPEKEASETTRTALDSKIETQTIVGHPPSQKDHHEGKKIVELPEGL